MAFDNNQYCDFSETAAKAMAGKDILLQVWDSAGANLLAIAGQQGLTINRSADSIEITSKDSDGWKDKIAGMKEWSIDIDGLFVAGDSSHTSLSTAYSNGTPVCIKVVKRVVTAGTASYTDMFGGIALIKDYPIEAPHDDAVTYSASFDGAGKLTDLQTETIHEYTQAELEGMTKSEIAEVAIQRGYDTVSEDETKAEMIADFLTEQSA